MTAHANLPAYSSLERVVQQATVVRQYLQQEVGKVTSLSTCQPVILLLYHTLLKLPSLVCAHCVMSSGDVICSSERTVYASFVHRRSSLYSPVRFN